MALYLEIVTPHFIFISFCVLFNNAKECIAKEWYQYIKRHPMSLHSSESVL